MLELPSLPESTILLVEVGSTAPGTGLPGGEDHDEMGVVEPAEWLRAVRRGEVPFSDWWERCLALDARLEQVLSDDTVPERPDRERIEAWSIDAHLAHWGSDRRR